MGGGNGVSPNGGSSGASTHNPMAVKVNQEVLTSLHLIKDIRRLEKYQRDFFVKVSLNHKLQQLTEYLSILEVEIRTVRNAGFAQKS